MSDIEQRLPGTVIYYGPERYGASKDEQIATVTDIARRGMRCQTDPRWRWPEPPLPLPAQELHAIDTALLTAHRGKLYCMATPDIPEMLRLNQHDPSRTCVIDVRPAPDEYLQMTWKSQYRWIGSHRQVDFDWWLLLGYSLIVLGRYVDSTGEQEQAS